VRLKQEAVRLLLLVILRLCQKGIKLARGSISLKLAIPGGCIEFRKPAPELRQFRGVEGFDSLLQGFHIGHGLSVRSTAHQSDANRLASPTPANRQRLQRQPCRRDFPLLPQQRLPRAIGRSAS
jgi:hypothetical protein